MALPDVLQVRRVMWHPLALHSFLVLPPVLHAFHSYAATPSLLTPRTKF